MNLQASDPGSPERCYHWADGAFDARRMTLRIGDRAVALDRASSQVLERLLQAPGAVVDKRVLLDCGWPGRVVSENSLSKCISRLRRLLGDTDGEQVALAHGYGYRWTLPVVRGPAWAPLPADDHARRLSQHGWHLGARIDERPDRFAYEASGPDGGVSHTVLLPPPLGSAARLQAEGEVQTRLARTADGDGQRVLRASAWHTAPDEAWLAFPRLDAPDLEAWAAAAGGWRAVPPDTRLSLLADLAEGVATYHRAGVAHGDVRPAALRVLDTAGGPRGVLLPALLQDDPEVDTRYRPPEGVPGTGADPAADLYALGVLLHQAAVGSFSHRFGPDWEDDVDDATLRHLVRSLARGHPAQRTPAAPDLVLQLRALCGRPEDRQRLAASEAERRVAEQALRASRRRLRWSLALSATLLLAGGLAIWQGFEAREAAAASRDARQRAEAVARFLSGSLLTRGDPYAGGVVDASLRESMAAAAATIDERFRDDPRGAAEVHETVADAFEAWGDYEATERHQRRAIALVERLDGPSAPALAPLQRQLCQQLRMKGDLPGAEAACQAAARIDVGAFGDVTPATRVEQAKIDYELGRCEAALPALDAVRTLPPDGLPPATVADAWWFTGLCRGQLGALGPAVEAFGVLVARQEQTLGPDHPMTAWAKVDQAMAMIDAGDLPSARRALAAAEAVFLATIGRDHPDFPTVTYGYAMLALVDGQAAAAADAFLEAERQWIAALGPAHYWTLYTGSFRARALAEAGRIDEAMAVLRQHRAHGDAVLAGRPAKASGFHEIWSAVYLRAGQWAEVEAAANAILAAPPRELPAAHPRRAYARCLLGLAALAAGDRPAAAAHHAVCEPLIAQLPPTDAQRRVAEDLRRRMAG